jgi:hypothetical protein
MWTEAKIPQALPCKGSSSSTVFWLGIYKLKINKAEFKPKWILTLQYQHRENHRAETDLRDSIYPYPEIRSRSVLKSNKK